MYIYIYIYIYRNSLYTCPGSFDHSHTCSLAYPLVHSLTVSLTLPLARLLTCFFVCTHAPNSSNGLQPPSLSVTLSFSHVLARQFLTHRFLQPSTRKPTHPSALQPSLPPCDILCKAKPTLAADAASTTHAVLDAEAAPVASRSTRCAVGLHVGLHNVCTGGWAVGGRVGTMGG